MCLESLTPPRGALKKRKRVGRGPGCHGKTSGKGHKGQRSRSGIHISPWFEGGQTPFKMRVPKRGFRNPGKVVYEIVNIKELNRFEVGSTVTPMELKRAGLIKKGAHIKILGSGQLKHPLKVEAQGFSKRALEKIKEAGGEVKII